MRRIVDRKDFQEEEDGLIARKRTLYDGLERDLEILELGDLEMEEGLDYISLVKTRGMGIASLRLAGLDIFWTSPVSQHVSPTFLEARDMNLLATAKEGMFRAGPFHIGGPEGEHPLHGSVSFTPARDVLMELHDGMGLVQGTLLFESLFGPLLRIETKTIFLPAESMVTVKDTVINDSRERSCTHMYMFHANCNPLSPHGTLHGRLQKTEPRDDAAEEHLRDFRRFGPSEPLFQEQVFYHWPARDSRGFCRMAIVHEDREKALSVAYGPGFPLLVQWKCLRMDFQVCGLEGSTSKVEGALVEEEEGRLIELEPEESREYEACFQAHIGKEAVEALLSEVD